MVREGLKEADPTEVIEHSHPCRSFGKLRVEKEVSELTSQVWKLIMLGSFIVIYVNPIKYVK